MDFRKKSKYFFTLYIVYYTYIYMLHIYIYLQGVLFGNAVVGRIEDQRGTP